MSWIWLERFRWTHANFKKIHTSKGCFCLTEQAYSKCCTPNIKHIEIPFLVMKNIKWFFPESFLPRQALFVTTALLIYFCYFSYVVASIYKSLFLCPQCHTSRLLPCTLAGKWRHGFIMLFLILFFTYICFDNGLNEKPYEPNPLKVRYRYCQNKLQTTKANTRVHKKGRTKLIYWFSCILYSTLPHQDNDSMVWILNENYSYNSNIPLRNSYIVDFGGGEHWAQYSYLPTAAL